MADQPTRPSSPRAPEPTPAPPPRGRPGDSTTDLSQFAQQAVDPPRRSEWWFGVGLLILVGFAVGVIFALR